MKSAMVVWTLFVLHKLLMIVIAYSFIRIILNSSKIWHKLLVSGFLVSQGVLNRCVVTVLENSVRHYYGYSETSNQFILHNLVGYNTGIYRVFFLIVGLFIIGTIIGDKIDKRKAKRFTEKVL